MGQSALKLTWGQYFEHFPLPNRPTLAHMDLVHTECPHALEEENEAELASRDAIGKGGSFPESPISQPQCREPLIAVTMTAG